MFFVCEEIVTEMMTVRTKRDEKIIMGENWISGVGIADVFVCEETVIEIMTAMKKKKDEKGCWRKM